MNNGPLPNLKWNSIISHFHIFPRFGGNNETCCQPRCPFHGTTRNPFGVPFSLTFFCFCFSIKYNRNGHRSIQREKRHAPVVFTIFPIFSAARSAVPIPLAPNLFLILNGLKLISFDSALNSLSNFIVFKFFFFEIWREIENEEIYQMIIASNLNGIIFFLKFNSILINAIRFSVEFST